jgi:hypothetical protein
MPNKIQLKTINDAINFGESLNYTVGHDDEVLLWLRTLNPDDPFDEADQYELDRSLDEFLNRLYDFVLGLA